MQRNGSMCVCLFPFSVESKTNLKSVIMVVWKEGREGALILQGDGDFFPLSQLSLGEHHVPNPEVSSAFKLGSFFFNGFVTHRARVMVAFSVYRTIILLNYQRHKLLLFPYQIEHLA